MFSNKMWVSCRETAREMKALKGAGSPRGDRRNPLKGERAGTPQEGEVFKPRPEEREVVGATACAKALRQGQAWDVKRWKVGRRGVEGGRVREVGSASWARVWTWPNHLRAFSWALAWPWHGLSVIPLASSGKWFGGQQE